MEQNDGGMYFSVDGQAYVLLFSVIKELCFGDDSLDRQREITERYELEEDEEGKSNLVLTDKVSRELKANLNNNNSSIIYDSIRVLLEKILEYEGSEEKLGDNFAVKFALNTLIYNGVVVKLEKITENE